MADAIWYLGQGGQQKGPFAEEDIKGMISRREVSRADLVWKEGMADWEPVAEVAEFAEAASALPPGPPPAPPPPAPPGAAAAAGPNPAAEFFSEFYADTMAIVKDPDAGATAVADREPVVFAAVWVGLKIILAGLLALQVHAALTGALGGVEGALRVVGRAMAGGGAYGQSGVATFFKTMLLDAISLAIVFGGLMLVMAGILRTAGAAQKALTIIGVSAIPVVLASVVAFVLGWLHLWFHSLVAAAVPASVVLFYHLFRHTTQAPRRVAIFCVAGILFCVALVQTGIPRF